jgi:hypothetical protein
MVHAATREFLTAHRKLVYVLRDTRKRKAEVRKDVTSNAISCQRSIGAARSSASTVAGPARR